MQLKLTYGGGKTHTLITLYHMVTSASSLPKLPSVDEFRTHIDIDPTEAKSRVVVLPFDKLDVEKGMEVVDPQGNKKWLKQPWSVIAYQVAGDEGLQLIHADGKAEERVSPPAQNVLEALLSLPARDGLGTLLLLDEVMMFARVAYDYDQSWASKLTNFFQYLTQAVESVERCALVASLLASDMKLDDSTGKKIRGDFENIFRRKQEPEIQPVEQQDVAELLRRRFFTPESIQNKDRFKTQVIAAMKGLAAIDDQIRKTQAAEEERFTDSYPFHPDLTDLLYTKWTAA